MQYAGTMRLGFHVAGSRHRGHPAQLRRLGGPMRCLRLRSHQGSRRRAVRCELQPRLCALPRCRVPARVSLP
eukprot:2444264-Rhodomonas_salina.1